MCLRLDSNDINSLIYQYLKEKGLEHTAFAFKAEADVESNLIKPGSLIKYLQKALSMEELLEHLNDETWLSQGIPNCNSEFRLLEKHKCRYYQPPCPLKETDSVVLMGHSDVITCLYYSDKVISGYCTFRSQDGTIRIWVQGLDPVILPHTAFDSTLAPVVSFDVSKNGLIASIAYDEKIRIWDNAILSKCWASPTTKSIVWSPDGNILMCINSDSLTIWDQSTAKVLEIPQKIERKSEFILSAQWRNNQEFSLVSNSDVWLWGLDTDPKLILNQTAACAKWNCNGSILGMVCGGRLGVYKDSGDIWWISGNVSQFDFTPLDDTVVTGGHAGEIQFWDLNKKTILKSFQGHQGKILNILHRHDGEFLATSALDGILHIWKTEDYLKTKSINIENIQDM